MERIIYTNGDLVRSSSNTGKLLTSSLLFGSGFFETVRLYNGFPFRLDKHLKRLNDGAKKIGFDLDLSVHTIEEIISELVAKNKVKDSRLRIWVGFDMDFYLSPKHSKNNFVLVIDAQPLSTPNGKFYKNGVKMQIYKVPRPVGSILCGIKTTSYMENLYAKRTAKIKGCFDALFVNSENVITESTTSNIFFVFNNKVYTPELGCGVLPGVTRDVVVEILKEHKIGFSETKIKLDDIKKAQESFLTSSIVEIMPVVKIENIKIGDGKPGKITKFIMDEFKKVVESEKKKYESRISDKIRF